ncbi:MAG: FGGY family carbohydrate kinase, partial [Actinoallomurus sp.]
MTVLAIDQGTSATKALVVRPDGTLAGQAERPFRTVSPSPGQVEVDPLDLLDSVLSAGRAALDEAGGPRPGVVALANQGETVLAWDRATGRPLSRCLVWQDRRAVEVCDRLRDHAGWLTELTGLPLDPYFSAPKMAWLREHETSDGVVTTSDSWLLHRLTGAFVTDAATASRSLLFDLAERRWSDEAWEIFGLAGDERPRVVRSDEVVATTSAFGGEVPVAGVIVDQSAALWAQRCRDLGDVKCTYGSGAFLVANCGSRPARSAAGLSASVAWTVAEGPRWCLDGQIYTVGTALTWLSSVGLLDGAADLDRLGDTVQDTAGAVFVPALAGLAAPYWQPGATGAFVGLTLAVTRAHLARAVCEGIAAQVTDLAMAAATDLGRPVTGLRVDGGLTRSRVLMQLQADLLQCPVEVFASPHATAFGAADLAARALGG